MVRNKIDDCYTEANTNEKQDFCAEGEFGTNRDKSKNLRELTAECGIQEICWCRRETTSQGSEPSITWKIEKFRHVLKKLELQEVR